MISRIYQTPKFATVKEAVDVTYEQAIQPFEIDTYAFKEGSFVIVLAEIEDGRFASGKGYVVYVDDILQSFAICSSWVKFEDN